jgi:cobyrinic acid a,c-diamide synthase
MTLGAALIDAAGVRHEMAGLLSVETSFAKRRMTLGYRRARLLADGALGSSGTLRLGHEFHYATVAAAGADEPFALVGDAYGAPESPVGSRRGRVSGSFFHVIA